MELPLNPDLLNYCKTSLFPFSKLFSQSLVKILSIIESLISIFQILARKIQPQGSEPFWVKTFYLENERSFSFSFIVYDKCLEAVHKCNRK